MPSPSHPLPFAAFFPSSHPLLLLLLPTPSFSIHISGGRLYERVCVCASAPFSAGQRPTSSPSALPYPPTPHLWLIQILLLVLCCSSFFRLKAMCHSLLLSLCLFLHLFLLLPPTQSLSPLPTTFSLVSVDVVVCKLLTVRVCVWLFVYVSGVFVCWGGNVCPANPSEACWCKPCIDLDVVVCWNLKAANRTHHCRGCVTSVYWILSGTSNYHTCVLNGNHLLGSERDHMTGPIDFAMQRAFWNGGEDANTLACKNTLPTVGHAPHHC